MATSTVTRRPRRPRQRIPKLPLKRAAFLLHRARHPLTHQVLHDIFRVLDSSLRPDDTMRRELLEAIRCLRSDLTFLTELVDDLERIITTGEDGRAFVATRSKAIDDNVWLRRQLEGLEDGGR